MIKFLRSKIIIFFIAVMTVLSLVAVVIGLRVSATMVKRHNQMLEKLPSEQNVLTQGINRPVSIGSLNTQKFYFNGEYIKTDAFITGNNQLYVPVDSILDRIGIKYNYYSSDDIIEFMLDKKKVLVTLGKEEITFGGVRIKLPAVPVAAKNHLLVPLEFLKLFDGFVSDNPDGKGTLFVNYYPGLKKDIIDRMRVLRLDGQGTPDISDISGSRTFWSRSLDGEGPGEIEVSPDGSRYIIKTKSKVYLGSNDNDSLPAAVNANPSATWSADGKYLYWIDEKNRTSYVYDIENREIEKLGDYYFKATSGGEKGYIMYQGKRLYVLKEDPQYKRIVLSNELYDSKYAFIEREGKTVVKGEASYSPDRSRLLYSEDGRFFYITNLTGSSRLFIGKGDEAQWVNNDRIFIRDGNKRYIYTRSEKTKTEVGVEWHKVGQTPERDTFFMVGDTLYVESDWVERKLMTITGGCDNVYALSPKGPFIIASSSSDSVFYIDTKSNAMKKLGKLSLLLKGFADGKIFTDFERSITASPDGKSFAVFQRDNDFIRLDVVSTDGARERQVFLSSPVNMDSETDRISSLWAGKGNLLVYSENRIWMIDFVAGTRVYEWFGKDGSSIKNVLP